ncbi:uncharacterized protein HKW66_Vig0246820 [Vigna angularis]|uniref:Uncharacterized protein n=1 Tax=Phaseolus angularis TaxID=3914 RepID=A0A8T0KVN5_PHAAN|nr:uncharacterized protein HKW66_Vig0246820 [Vigna angularis]
MATAFDFRWRRRSQWIEKLFAQRKQTEPRFSTSHFETRRLRFKICLRQGSKIHRRGCRVKAFSSQEGRRGCGIAEVSNIRERSGAGGEGVFDEGGEEGDMRERGMRDSSVEQGSEGVYYGDGACCQKS